MMQPEGLRLRKTDHTDAALLQCLHGNATARPFAYNFSLQPPTGHILDAFSKEEKRAKVAVGM